MPDSPTTASRPPLLRLLVLLTLGTVAIALWFLVSHLLRDIGQVRWYPESPECQLSSGPCLARLGEERQLTLDLGVRGEIRALQRLPLEVSLQGVKAERVMVDFVGRDMDMGLHRYPLSLGADGHYRGEGQIPICTEAVMPWRARVVIETADGKLGSGFDFEVRGDAP
ncbi:hypothetical protein IOC61_09625 [Halomonas sp. KAO]|uniref:hypothetical protein n=1 Tax=unclassified Halomonas TaxID=2609666 RepID=UPI00189E8080|nr:MULTISPECIES: hypothetical protein [unclassified Halomonas]MBF7053585.1 hypothetical protein [Halomonas sp. KAO]MDT0500864.1 hypothetical protein [Halomonas sp. PAR7]MDT0512600.1 hypothetical protein [Halomonas sp. LES1]MDT0592818.1 hypothetical protein [Halomonas sp. PAR8]